MHEISISGAIQAPPDLQSLQARRITARVRASSAVAGLVAGLAFAMPKRDDVAALASVTADRVSAATGAVRL